MSIIVTKTEMHYLTSWQMFIRTWNLTGRFSNLGARVHNISLFFIRTEIHGFVILRAIIPLQTLVLRALITV